MLQVVGKVKSGMLEICMFRILFNIADTEQQQVQLGWEGSGTSAGHGEGESKQTTQT